MSNLLSGIAPSAKDEAPPDGPVAQCLNCRCDFVWWLHPVQLCDGCVELEYAKARAESADDAADRRLTVPHQR